MTTEITLSYLQLLNKRTEINKLEKKVAEMRRIIDPLLNELEEIKATIRSLKATKTQAIVEYYVEQAVKRAFGRDTEVSWRESDLQQGLLVVYDDYGHGDIDTYRATIDEDLTVRRVGLEVPSPET